MAHLYINGMFDLDIGKEFTDDPKNGYKIGYNTGIKAISGVNTHEHQLNDGKSYIQHNGTKSKQITCTHIFSDEDLDEGLIGQLDLLMHHMKTTALPTIVYVDDGYGGNGSIVESIMAKVNVYEKEYGIQGIASIDFKFIEHKGSDTKTTTFDTFNKKTTTAKKKEIMPLKVGQEYTSKISSKETPSYIRDLLSCKPVKNESKKGVSCVISLQKMLKSDGKYLKYLTDGWFWTFTEQELKAWQRDIAKVKATGTWTKECIDYLKKKHSI